MSIVLTTLKGVAGLIGYALRTFALTMLVVDLLYGILLCGVSIWIASNGSTLRGVLAGILAAIAVIIIGVLVAAQVTVLATIARAVREAALGRRVFDTLLELAFGITEDRPEGDPERAPNIHGMSVDEIHERLNAAADTLLRPETPADLSGLALWLALRIQRAIVWVTIKIIIRSCVRDDDSRSIDLLVLRTRLADVIDRQIIDYMRVHQMRLLFAIISLTTTVVGLLALMIRWLPI